MYHSTNTQSPQSFDKTEINVMNNGLNLAILPTKNALNNIMACIESSVLYMSELSRGFTRERKKQQIGAEIKKKRSKSNVHKIIKRLKEKMFLFECRLR